MDELRTKELSNTNIIPRDTGLLLFLFQINMLKLKIRFNLCDYLTAVYVAAQLDSWISTIKLVSTLLS